MSNHIYPWEEWFQRKRFTVSRGAEFKCTTRGMIQQIRDAGVRHGIKVSIQAEEDTINVTVRNGK